MIEVGGSAPLHLPEEIVGIAQRLEDAGYETWCVGGAIRDALLGSSRSDVDLATAATPEQVQRLFRRTVPIGLKFGTVGVFDGQRGLHEVTTFRRDVLTDGRHAEVEYGVSLDDDLARRDLTINAIAYHPITHDWRDPFGGGADLKRRIVRAVGDPAARFREDFLRVLRALRFAARLGFDIDEATWSAAKAAAPGLAQLSAERVRDEWFRSLESALSLPRLLQLWHQVGAAAVLLPELLPDYPLADPAPGLRDAVLLTALLCEDPCVVLERLRCSNADRDRVGRVVAAPVAPTDGSVVSVRRWLAEVGPAADDVLASALLRTGAAPPWAAEVTAIRQRGDPLTRGALAITGSDLREAGVTAGPEIGRVLERLLDLVLNEPALNQRDALLKRVGAFRDAGEGV